MQQGRYQLPAGAYPLLSSLLRLVKAREALEAYGLQAMADVLTGHHKMATDQDHLQLPSDDDATGRTSSSSSDTCAPSRGREGRD